MSAPLDELYFKWLYGKVASLKQNNPSRTYWDLLRQLYVREFVWFVPNDDNRAGDGLLLRDDFLEETGAPFDEDWMGQPCSIFEMLIALSNRLVYHSEGNTRKWFWTLLENLGLRGASDTSKFDHEEVNDILDRLLDRTYEPTGAGGLFPLKRPTDDQRHIEVWYQLHAYLNERREDREFGLL